MSHNLKYGLFLGFISIALTLSIVMIDPTLMVATWFQILSLLINIAIMVIAGIELRKQQGGYLSFKNAFVSTLIIIAIGSAISTVYSIIQFNVIDPSLKETISESVINRTVGMLENFGADDQVIDEAVANLEGQDTFGTQTLLMGYLYSLVGGAIIALIIAAIVKKKEPEFD
ncbi:MAG: DUF4199 domain-containing protein [Cyclobacteriaceae bacterium]